MTQLPSEYEQFAIDTEKFATAVQSITAHDSVRDVKHIPRDSLLEIRLDDNSSVEFDFTDCFSNLEGSENVGIDEMSWAEIDGEEVFVVLVDIGSILNCSSGEKDIFPEEIAFLKMELGFFEQLFEVEIVDEYNSSLEQRVVSVEFENEIRSSLWFERFMSNLGLPYISHKFETSNGEISKLVFKRDTQMRFTISSSDYLKVDKLKQQKKREFNTHKSIVGSCGHTLHPDIFVVSGLVTNDASQFESVEFDDISYYKIPVNYDEDGDMSVDVEGSTGGGAVMKVGLYCEECSVLYIPEDKNMLYKEYSDSYDLEVQTVEMGEDEFKFASYEFPYYPSYLEENF